MSNYLYSDFVFLTAVCKKRNQKLSDIFTSASFALQFPFTKGQLIHALGVLHAGGYITFSGNVTVADLVVSATEKGYNATKTGFFALLSSRVRETELLKLEQAFCLNTEAADSFDVAITDDEYVAINRKLYADYSISVPFVEAFVRDGKLSFSFRSSGCGYSPMGSGESELAVEDDDEILKNSLDVICNDEKYADGLLAATCDFLLVSSKVRKFALEGHGGVYLFSLSYVKDGARLTAAKILYNKQRFIGKRDGDLDYAQCGENILDITISPALLSAAVLRAYASVPSVLTENMLNMMTELRSAGV
ncbi:MAG: hypothetical protein IJX74_01165 [Clostridia bacterium]|nr:hypothetical protein [Clostridia bacterium]